MIIIKNPEMQCDKCHTITEFTKNEIIFTKNIGKKDECYFVCPVCFNQIKVRELDKNDEYYKNKKEW